MSIETMKNLKIQEFVKELEQRQHLCVTDNSIKMSWCGKKYCNKKTRKRQS